MAMENSEISEYISEIPDEVLARISFSVPWQYDTEEKDREGRDSDGFALSTSELQEDTKQTRDVLQLQCWKKFNRNPQMNTAVRGLVGRLTGMGYGVASERMEIQEVIEEIEQDPRNRLYNFWPKYVGRKKIFGELFLCLTCHTDGFIEVDFVDAQSVGSGSGGDDDTGILFHPNKPTMPLFYNIKNGDEEIQYPSIFIARYPDMVSVVRGNTDFKRSKQGKCRSRRKIFKKFGGYYRFIVAWEEGYLTRRAISYLRTTIEWLNHYENLKKYEIDHKKSSGAYLWVFKITDSRTFKQWLQLSDDDRRKTGILSKKTPGGSLVLPPGIELDVKNPNLTRISEQDTDIMQMAASGLNEPEDILSGTSKGTYASVKATRGPMSDRISDEIIYFERFLRFDFWRSIFWLKSNIDISFKEVYKVREALSFDKDGEPVFGNRNRRADQLIDFSWPISEILDYEGRSKAFLGAKHGPVSEVVGIPGSEVARRMGFGNYGRLRLQHATEKERYPELVYTIDQESFQETIEGEPKKKAKSKEEE